jgi:hypothetical protein
MSSKIVLPQIPSSELLVSPAPTSDDAIPTEVVEIKKPRRLVLKFLAASVMAKVIATAGYARFIEPHWIDEQDVALKVPQLPSAWEGRRVVQISDLHVGDVVDLEYLKSAIDRVNQLAPDMIFITGDIVNRNTPAEESTAQALLQKLVIPKQGIYGTLGNHDYGHGWRHLDRGDMLSFQLEKLGIKMLRNDLEIVDGLQIAGIDDFWGPNFHPEKVLPKINPELPSLVLCHNPDVLDLKGWDNVRGCVFAGHTHGGQVKLPFLPPPFLSVKNKNYVAGMYDIRDHLQLYINRGLGYSRKVRLNMRPEITIVKLERAEASA